MNEVSAALHAGDLQRALQTLAQLTPRARRQLAPELIALCRRWSQGAVKEDPARPGVYGFVFDEGSDAQREAARTVVIVVATASELARGSQMPWLTDPQQVLAAARVVRPPWLDAEGLRALARARRINWATVEALVAAGLCERPTADELIESMIEGIGFRSDAPLAELLRAQPGLIAAGVLYRVFEVEGGQQSSLAAADKYRREQNQWATALIALSASGELDRGRLLDGALAALARDFAAFRAGWFARFHDQLAPSDAERSARAAAYLRLLGSAIPATVSFAVKAAERLVKLGAVTPEALFAALPPALQARQKGTVKRAVKLLRAVVQRAPETAAPAVALAIDALAHPEVDVQAALLDAIEPLLARCGAEAPALRERLAATREQLAPSLRARLPGGAAPPPAVEPYAAGAPPPAADPYDARHALAFAGSHEQALDLVAYALEHTDDPLAQERALDAIARHAVRTASWDALAGPLRRRATALWRRARFADDLQAALTYLALAWAGGVEVDWPARQYANVGVAFKVYFRRLAALATRVRDGLALPLLSTPTHRGGFIAPAAFSARCAAWRRAGVEPDVHDALLALLRLPPPARRRARGALAPQDRAAAQALDQAASPRAAARYALRVRSRRSGPYTFYEVEARPQGAGRSSKSPYALLQALASGEAYDGGASDEGGLGGGAATARWAATATPDDLAPHFAEGIRYLGFNLDGSLSGGVYLEPARHPWVALGSTGHWLLALALAARGPQAIQVALDVASDGIAQGRVQAQALGGALGAMMPTGILKAKRLATTLAQVAEASPQHARAIAETIAGSLRGDPASAPRDVAPLLSLLHELLVAAGTPLADAEARRWLAAQTRGGQLAKLRRAILAL